MKIQQAKTYASHAAALSVLYSAGAGGLRGDINIDEVKMQVVAQKNALVGFMRGCKNTLYIAGTNDMTDWRQNLNLFGNAEYHDGFLRHANAVWALWRAEFGGDKPDLIVGHSLGGAAAAILGVEYMRPALTFGAPRFGRRALRLNYTKYQMACDLLVHLQIKGDIVPNRPGGLGLGNWRLPYFCRPGVELRFRPVSPAGSGLPSPLYCHSTSTYRLTLERM